jgi:hypothetical protein
MQYGSLTDVFENGQNIYNIIKNINANNVQRQYGFKQTGIDDGQHKPKFKISSILKKISRGGIDYSEDVLLNSVALPADKSQLIKTDANLGAEAFYQNNYLLKQEEYNKFSEKTLIDKITVLRELAKQPEIENILDIISNESIVYNSDDNYLCQPFIDNSLTYSLNEDVLEELNQYLLVAFSKIYYLIRMADNGWSLFRKFLIDGVLAFEIVYDNIQNPHDVIGIVPLDPTTLTKHYNSSTNNHHPSELFWVQFEGNSRFERKLSDSQIIYIKYNDDGITERQSYLERLIRPFNIYRIIEQAQIIWTVTQASFKTIFTIPVGGQSKAKGVQTLNAAMSKYKEDISFNNDTGELKVNGKVNLPFNKEYWMPQNENGTPQIETLTDQGPQLNDSDQLKYFLSKLYKISKIPESRFDKEAGATWFGTDATQALRDEINFERFISRIRHTFSEIILKPLRIQILLNIPKLKNDANILNSISLKYFSYNQFQEMMEVEIDQKRMEYIQTLKDTFVDTDKDGNEVPYFSNKFLLIKYLKIQQADLELNMKYKLEEQQEKSTMKDSKEDSDDDSGGLDMGGNDESSESDDDSSNEPDKEMMGDVQDEPASNLSL